MKIIHTSDWHLGQILYGYDRTEENIFFLKQLKAIILEEKPDALLVSGDIFDVSTPSTSIIRILNDFLIQLRNSMPDLTIVVISGNHDSASRIDVYRNLWEQINVHVIGKIERKNKEYLFEGNIIEIKNKGFIVAIPFINRAFMNLPGGGENIERHFFNEIEKVVKEKNIYGLPVILMSHLSVTGCDTEGHRFSQIGNLNSVSAEIFNEGYDYIALGHIHKPQTIDTHNRIRYSGSPIQISFDEKYEHSVSIVDIDKGASPQIKEIVINPLRSLLTIPETPTSFNKALKLLSKLPSEETAYIRLNIEQVDDLPSDCEERAVNAASGKSCRYCLIKYNREKQRKEESQFKELHIDDFLSSSPIEIADRFFRSMGFEEEKVIQFNSLIRELMSEIEQKKQS